MIGRSVPIEEQIFNRGTTTKERGTKGRCYQSALSSRRLRANRPNPESQTRHHRHPYQKPKGNSHSCVVRHIAVSFRAVADNRTSSRRLVSTLQLIAAAQSCSRPARGSRVSCVDHASETNLTKPFTQICVGRRQVNEHPISLQESAATPKHAQICLMLLRIHGPLSLSASGRAEHWPFRGSERSQAM
jgi:hypothetical protein